MLMVVVCPDIKVSKLCFLSLSDRTPSFDALACTQWVWPTVAPGTTRPSDACCMLLWVFPVWSCHNTLFHQMRDGSFILGAKQLASFCIMIVWNPSFHGKRHASQIFNLALQKVFTVSSFVLMSKWILELWQKKFSLSLGLWPLTSKF